MSQNTPVTSPTEAFRAARDLLLAHGDDLDAAHRAFRWPRPAAFNWALDWFDAVAARRDGPALRLARAGDPAGDVTVTWRALSRRSAQVANWLRGQGLRRGDPVMLLLDNRVPVWETMLAAIKLGAVLIPTYITATPAELADRADRGGVRFVVAEAALAGRYGPGPHPWRGVAVGGPPPPGWSSYEESRTAPQEFVPDGPTGADDPLFRYFTSGTTSAPKMVEHTHTSYPVGHLSGMYWNGVRPGDVHLNVSAPGWAKHSWSSFFVPWNAEATVLALDSATAADAGDVLEVLRTRGVTTFCAPPTTWRAMVAAGLGPRPAGLREAVAAGEPLEAALARAVREAWGVDVRDGFGQTETTGLIGSPPGRPPVPGSMGRALPGYRLAVVDPGTGREVPDGESGELCVDLAERPAGLMRGYADDPRKTARAFAGGYYHTGDLVVRAPDGSFTYVARADDMFKSFDHRISPLELERVLLRHPAVADAAVVPVPDPVGLWAAKAYLTLVPGRAGGAEAARGVFALVRRELPEEKWVRVVEFADGLPRTRSGKVRRAALKGRAPGMEFRMETHAGADAFTDAGASTGPGTDAGAGADAGAGTGLGSGADAGAGSAAAR
ncbi:acetyl-CoA synthetase [Streptomyces sp. 3211.6]|uniref:AMP-binding protein n=1 Tax=Streptomyces sp. 3211.6 TaxID=1938845 RepID=UPI000EB0AFE2|nr:AMP-binding protein [Streptomyces sp. 3211.6]RKT02610.1 acetyl-CoA synthetase [Streptomyces sp. 3211.6]